MGSPSVGSRLGTRFGSYELRRVDRHRRDGRGLPRLRHRARADGGAQAAADRRGGRPELPGPFPARVAHRGAAAGAARDPRARLRRDRRRALHRHAPGRGRQREGRAARQRRAPAGAGGVDHHARSPRRWTPRTPTGWCTATSSPRTCCSRRTTSPTWSTSASPTAAARRRVTKTGLVIGSCAYMATERLSGKPGGPPSDVYSLTCLLYECLTGRAPFEGG